MELKGHVQYNPSTDIFDLAMWVEDAGQVVTAALGSLNYQIYDFNGTLLTNPGASGSGIAPAASGLYFVNDVVDPEFLSNNESFLVYVETTLGGNPVSTFIPFTVNTL